MTNFNCPKCGSSDTDSLTWHSYTCYGCNTHFEPQKCDSCHAVNGKGKLLPCQFCSIGKGLNRKIIIIDEAEWIKVTPIEKNKKRLQKYRWKNSNDLFKSVFNKKLETTYKNNEEGC